MTETKYIGITIGPIFDTMNLSSSPCALWASSFIFSYISRRTCELLVSDYNVPEDNIISPVFKYENDEKLKKIVSRKDGVGLFHDRIIFISPNEKLQDSFDLEKVIKEIRNKVLDEINRKFKIENIDFLKEYIMISAAEYTAENPIMGSGKILDSIELSKPFVRRESVNPILNIFTGANETDSEESKNTKNALIKRIVQNLECVDVSEWQLAKGENRIKDLSSIAHVNKNNNKYNKYYAVVRSDGDNISKIISSLESYEDFSKFSSACFKYCGEISDTVKAYGGVAVYAGGDDLLALMPCYCDNINEYDRVFIEDNESVKQGTILNFIKAANRIFAENFKEFINKINDENSRQPDESKKKPVPTLSFGIMICYKKFPLYEALEKSAELLFYKAKSERNCSVICLQKHSGQSVELKIPNNSLEELIKLQNRTIIKNDKVLLSSLQKILLFKVLFNSVKTDDAIKNTFINTFDSSSHADNDFLHKHLPDYFAKLKSGSPVFSQDEKEGAAEILSEILRFLKFFVEEGD